MCSEPTTRALLRSHSLTFAHTRSHFSVFEKATVRARLSPCNWVFALHERRLIDVRNEEEREKDAPDGARDRVKCWQSGD